MEVKGWRFPTRAFNPHDCWVARVLSGTLSQYFLGIIEISANLEGHYRQGSGISTV